MREACIDATTMGEESPSSAVVSHWRTRRVSMTQLNGALRRKARCAQTCARARGGAEQERQSAQETSAGDRSRDKSMAHRGPGDDSHRTVHSSRSSQMDTATEVASSHALLCGFMPHATAHATCGSINSSRCASGLGPAAWPPAAVIDDSIRWFQGHRTLFIGDSTLDNKWLMTYVRGPSSPPCSAYQIRTCTCRCVVVP